MKISNCCGAPAFFRGADFEDSGICSQCREHCEYIDDKEYDDEFNRELLMEHYTDHPDYLKAEDAKNKKQ